MRAVLRIAETKDFAIAYDRANEDQKSKLISISTAKDMRVWIALVMDSPLSSLSYRKLRDLAKQDNVHNYSRLDRDGLIRELERIRARVFHTSREAFIGNETIPSDVRRPG